MDAGEIKIRKQDEFFKTYINNPSRENDWKDPRFKKMLELINTIDDKGIKIADIGCGLGDFLYLLRRNGYKNIEGFDVSKIAVDFACERGLKVVLTKEYLDNVNDKFDLIVCGDILEHIFAPESFLDRLRGLLNPNGRLLVSVPNFGCLYNNCLVAILPSEVAKAASFATHTHINHFILSTLKELLCMEGFSVVKEAGIKLTTKIYPGSRRDPIKYLTKILFNMLVPVNNIFVSTNAELFSPHLILLVRLADKPKDYKSVYWS